jgi:hypothetical protein
MVPWSYCDGFHLRRRRAVGVLGGDGEAIEVKNLLDGDGKLFLEIQLSGD